jgi:hypothetical protein
LRLKIINIEIIKSEKQQVSLMYGEQDQKRLGKIYSIKVPFKRTREEEE